MNNNAKGNKMYQGFSEDIKKFNETFGVESNHAPTNLGAGRLEKFIDILLEEMEEGEGIPHIDSIETLTEISDWFGDLIIYIASEARRWGIPLDGILKIIMESNFSKLDQNGKPIIDERGKILKGPNYWKPEKAIKELLISKLEG